MSYSYHDHDRGSSESRTSNPIWTRGIIMLLFIFAFGVAQTVLYALAVIQFLWMLIKGERNVFIADLGASLGLWLADTSRFLTGDTDEKPFPWKPWPVA